MKACAGLSTSDLPKPTMRRITVVGEALLDVVVSDSGERREHPGGSPANVAVTLARLGVPVTLLTDIGEDEPGWAVSAHLAGNGVDVRSHTPTSRATSVAHALLDSAGAATYAFQLRWDPPPPLEAPPGTGCVHVGSLGTALQPGAEAVRELVQGLRAEATVSYDPNCRPAVTPDSAAARADVETWVAQADVVKGSDEDVAWLYPHLTVSEVADRWHSLGPAIVVITRGADGLHARCAAGVLQRPAEPVAVRDTVGAGDAFTGALLHGLGAEGLLGADRRPHLAAVTLPCLDRLLRYAAVVAALTCARQGADPPTDAEVRSSGSLTEPLVPLGEAVVGVSGRTAADQCRHHDRHR